MSTSAVIESMQTSAVHGLRYIRKKYMKNIRVFFGNIPQKKKEGKNMKTTLKEIKNFSAVDITRKSFQEVNEIMHGHSFQTIAYSVGIYGVTGIIKARDDGKLFKVTARSSALFQLGM